MYPRISRWRAFCQCYIFRSIYIHICFRSLRFFCLLKIVTIGLCLAKQFYLSLCHLKNWWDPTYRTTFIERPNAIDKVRLRDMNECVVVKMLKQRHVLKLFWASICQSKCQWLNSLAFEKIDVKFENALKWKIPASWDAEKATKMSHFSPPKKSSKMKNMLQVRMTSSVHWFLLHDLNNANHAFNKPLENDMLWKSYERSSRSILCTGEWTFDQNQRLHLFEISVGIFFTFSHFHFLISWQVNFS